MSAHVVTEGRSKYHEAALEYARQGFRVFPLQPTKKIPFGGTSGFRDASIDPDQINAWWGRHMLANVGIATGASGLFVVDLDPDPTEGRDIESMLAALAERFGAETLKTRTSMSPNHGGRHLLFRANGCEYTIGQDVLGEGIDIRAIGGYIVAPPSFVDPEPAKHKPGGTYKWMDESVEIAELPASIVAALADRPKKTASTTKHAAPNGKIAGWAGVLQQVLDAKLLDDLVAMDGKRVRCPFAAEHKHREEQQYSGYFIFDQGAGYRCQYEEHGLSVLDFLVKIGYADSPSAARRRLGTAKIHVPSFQNLVVLRGDEVEPTEVRWLWDGRLPYGKVTVFAGEKGIGKTMIAMFIAAAMSKGGKLPGVDGRPETIEAGDVLVINLEDDVDDTLLPRAIASGVDRSRVWFVDGMRNEKGQHRPFGAEDVDELRKFLVEHPSIRLIIIDPLMSYISGKVDAHRANQMREAMSSTYDLVRNSPNDLAILVVTHVRKSDGRNALERILGSEAITSQARQVLMADWEIAYDPTSGEPVQKRRMFYNAATNLTGPTPPIPFTFDEGGAIELGSADLALRGKDPAHPPKPAKKQHLSLKDRAALWLEDELSDGQPRPAKELTDRMAAQGFSRGAREDAVRELGIEPRKDGMRGGWLWQLPVEAPM